MRRLVLACALACGPTNTDPAEPPQPVELADEQPSEAPSARQAPTGDSPELPRPKAHERPADTPSADAARPPQEPEPTLAQPEPGTLRLVVVHAPPDLLKSELREIQALETKLLGDGLRITREPASEAERAYIEGTTTALPESWSRFESVIAIRVADPRVSKEGKRFAQGVRDLLVVRPPDASPIYSERTNAPGGPRLDGDAQARWLSVLIGATTTAKTAMTRATKAEGE